MAQSAEKIIHDKLVKLAEEMFEKYGIRIEGVKFDWTKVDGGDEWLYRLDSISMQTKVG